MSASADGWKTVRIRVARYVAIVAKAKAEGVSASAWIDRALDAALREPGEGQPVESGPADASGSIPRLSSSAPRRASGERARPAAAAGGGTDQPPPGLGHASSAQVKRGVKPIPKAKR
jgi:hypothetical protein